MTVRRIYGKYSEYGCLLFRNGLFVGRIVGPTETMDFAGSVWLSVESVSRFR